MIDLDTIVFQLLNQAGNPFWDPVMLFFSSKWVWLPLYVYLIIRLYKIYKLDIWLPLILIGLMVTATDQLTSSLMKPGFQRLRPCHENTLESVSTVNDNCGGLYGFPSSHAANTMALAVFITGIWGVRSTLSLFMILWSLVIGYSRIYLGVHYPGDVLVGFLLGAFSSVLIVNLFGTRLRVS